MRHVFFCRLWTVASAVAVLAGIANASVSNNPTLNSVFAEALGDASIAELVIPPSLLTSHPGSYGLNASCFNVSDGYIGLKTCLASQCASREDVAKLYGTTTTSRLLPLDVHAVAPGVLYVLSQRYRRTQCLPSTLQPQSSHRAAPPGPAAVWGYSFLFVTVINLCSLMGILLSFCMHLKAYKLILMFLVAIAVGTLVGSGLLVLIPEALELGKSGDQHYIWKICAVMGGVYLFFMVERVMRMINTFRQKTREDRALDEDAMHDNVTASFQMHPVQKPHLHDPIPGSPAHGRYTATTHGHQPHSSAIGHVNTIFVDEEESKARTTTTATATTQASTTAAPTVEVGKSENGLQSSKTRVSLSDDSLKKPQGHGHSHGSGTVAPVAYMIVFGDAVHNFIDGLSIGAAFSEKTLLGVSVALAVFCEELPHELGDFAILLNSGLSTRRALCYNFLSSISCYVGLVIGIVLGENTTANHWIFAIAGGMFLYISLTDMLPEMNSVAESEVCQEFGEVKTFLLQNVGLILGYSIILIIAIYGSEINISD